MSSEDSLDLEKIYSQFKRETEVIKEYIDFMEKSVVLNGLSENVHYNDDIKSIQSKIEILKQKNLEDISTLQSSIEKSQLYEIPVWFAIIDARSEEGEFVNYIFELIDSNITDREKILAETQGELEAMCITKGDLIGGDFYLELYDNQEKTYEYIDNSLKAFHNNSVSDTEKELEVLKNYEKLLRLIDIRNNINIYRQAFIQLVALFDALVFECFRIQFSRNFFVWLKFFDNDNIKLHEIANSNNFDDFKIMIIEKKLKSLYLKDLLDVLNKHNSLCFNIDGEIKYVYFREMINRRNCHIHNNGIVDKAYLGIDKSNTNQIFNVFNFVIGSYAEIDKEYLNIAIDYCSEFIKYITQI